LEGLIVSIRFQADADLNQATVTDVLRRDPNIDLKTILEAVHDTAKGLHKAGVMDQVTLREFDRLCLPPIEPLKPEQIKKIREDSRVSQAVFAAILNTSLSTIQKWEIGQKRPTGAALKLLHLVQKRGLESVV
jgi:putative transcriptional regulator